MTRERRLFVAVALAALLVGSSAAGSALAASAAVSHAAAGDAAPDAGAAPDAADDNRTDAFQYEVSLDNVTIRTWLLRNSTVLNSTVEEVVVREAATVDGNRTNVTLTNATVGEFEIERGRLKNVTGDTLVVRNKSILDIPGGDFIDPDVSDRVIDRHWTENETVSGVVIDRVVVDTAVLCGNATLGEQADQDAQYDPTAGESEPDISVENGSASEALIINGTASNWSVESIDQSDVTNGSLPQGCDRG